VLHERDDRDRGGRKRGVDFTVTANTDGRSRTGAIVIDGQIVVVPQPAQ
jgi:hypothetical protein